MTVPLPRDIDRQFVADLEAVRQWRDGLDGAPPLTVGSPGATPEVLAAVERISAWRPVGDPQPEPVHQHRPISYVGVPGRVQPLPVSATWRDDLREGARDFLTPVELARRRGWPGTWRFRRLLPDDVSHADLIEVLGTTLISRRGVLGRHEGRFQCHLCGLWGPRVRTHVTGFHGRDADAYVEEFDVYISGKKLGQSVTEVEAAETARAAAAAEAFRRRRAAEAKELAATRRRQAATRRRQKAREDRRRQEQKAREDRRRQEEKAREDRRRQEEKAREDRRRQEASEKARREAELKNSRALQAAATEQRRQRAAALIEERRRAVRAAQADKLQESLVPVEKGRAGPAKERSVARGEGVRRTQAPASAREWDDLLRAHGYSGMESAIRSVVLAGGSNSDLARILDVKVRDLDRRVREVQRAQAK